MWRNNLRARRGSQLRRRSHAFGVGASALVLIMFTLLLMLQFMGSLGDEPWPGPDVRQATVQSVQL